MTYDTTQLRMYGAPEHGVKLREYREKNKRMTLHALGSLIGLTVGQLGRIERGEAKPTNEQLVLIERFWRETEK